jgi:hypothetical protein
MRNRSGIAMLMAMLGIIVVGAVITGSYSAALVEQRVGENTRRQGQAYAAAEAGISENIANWKTGTWNSLSLGNTAAISGSGPNGVGTYAGTVRKLNSQLYFFDVTGKDRYNRSKQRLGAMARIILISMDLQAALTTRAGAGSQIGGTSQISGFDVPPWPDECPPPGGGTPGIRTQNPPNITGDGAACANLACVTGNPVGVCYRNGQGCNPLPSGSAADATFFNYGDATWTTLTSIATIRLAGSNYQNILPQVDADGFCNMSTVYNWGEPQRPADVPACTSYFPIIYAPRDLSINTGRGQGILLVEGNITIAGNFVFDGIIIAKGSLSTFGTGNHMTGAVLAANVDLNREQVMGDAMIQYSSCAITQAQTAASTGVPLRARAWVQLF